MNRTGIGIDFHRFGKGRKLILGGVQLDHPKGLLGHSDADCLIHSLVDAILGAMGKGDIGTFFPDTDKKYKNMDSTIFLKKAVALAEAEGYIIQNIDSTIICERPKLLPYIKAMKEKLSATIRISHNRIGIKATTTEQMGFLGRKEGIACIAVALLAKKKKLSKKKREQK